MRYTLRSHCVGLAGFAVACALGISSVRIAEGFQSTLLAATARAPSIDDLHPPRDYSSASPAWISCGEPRADGDRERWSGDSKGWSYGCTDGAQLVCVRYRCRSAEGAASELRARVTPFGKLMPGWALDEAQQYGRGTLARFSSPHHHEMDTVAVFGWVYLQVSGKDLVAVYGPSRAHVVELVDANPDRLW
jgi:hypothetical protein